MCCFLFKRIHPSIYGELKKFQAETRKLKVNVDDKCSSREHFETFFNKTPKNRTKKISDEELMNLIVDHVVTEMLPISSVTKPTFKNLLKGVYGSSELKIPCDKSVKKYIIGARENVVNKLVAEFAEIKYVSTTADIWSSRNKSYMGITAHYISEDFSRKSFALCVRRFKGSHTFEKIAAIISRVHDEYQLKHAQVVATVTDNASNFKKSFRLFGNDLLMEDFKTCENNSESDIESEEETEDIIVCENILNRDE